MENGLDHTGEVAVVTGGGTGIGAATAMLFAQHGADVVLASRRVENLERVAADVEAATGRRAHVVATDVRDVEQCERLIDESLAEMGRVDVLVNNAGGSHSYAFEDWNADRFQNMIDLNLKSAFGAAKAGLENLTQNFAAALAPHGIRVNCVRVGAIKSEGFLRAMDAAGIDPDEMGGRAAGLGRAGTPDEIAWPVLFLASAASS